MMSRTCRIVLLCLCTILFLKRVDSITDQEIQACDALWRNNLEASNVRGGVFNASRCCTDLRLDGILIYCSNDESAILRMSVYGSASMQPIDIEFEEFRLFHQLQSLLLDGETVRPRTALSCFPTGLHLLPNITALTFTNFACLPPDDYFRNFTTISNLEISKVPPELPLPPGLAELNGTLKSLVFTQSTLSVTYPVYPIPSSWSAFDLTTLSLNGLFEYTSFSEFLLSQRSLSSLYYVSILPSNTTNVLPPLPELSELFLDLGGVILPPDTFRGFTGLQFLSINSKMEHFPSSAFQLQNIVEISINIESLGYSAVLNDTENSWNSSSLRILTIYAPAVKIQIPASINNLTNLEFLTLNAGTYERLPSDLSGLVSLRGVTLKNINSPNASLAFAPLSTLPNLTELRISSIGTDNQWIWDLRTLKFLDFFDPLQDLDVKGLGNLVNLEFLSVWADLTSEFPPGMGNMTRLKNLRLWSNAVGGPTSFPASWGNMVSLSTLSLSGFAIRSGGFPDLALFPNLTTVDFLGVSGMLPPNLDGANNLVYFSFE
eukprot:TRINITY_DN2313_c0_g3_i4.p1 TRINITY_DN2313_c0_g3~~TRINITY_DN2313_c0_g3_i4.p1  ORF type:complete len:547 (-),score=45.83 TRINITY_DN2313_c0_g3_i4:1096-2736(-)